MAQENHCPQCGENLPPDAPEGLCPKCLMKAVQPSYGLLKENDVDATLEQSHLIEGPGTKIGRYELLSLIGEGGMGLVYQAEQKEPVKRRVALKIIKPGMDSRQVFARFEAERQALALLDHPNIAHVFDAGTTEAGRPYFVMEYVKGMSITAYCDEYKLDIENRLKLFENVCEGIHHAHQKGIIHRDIKPSNILVSVHGDRAVPKIIDFGIAKAAASSLSKKTVFTCQGQLLGTPEYMSPEQVDLATQDIDTRSDIYSLGVVLYELLAGVLPFERESLHKIGLAELQRTLRELEPASPSVRLSNLGQQAKAIADNRMTQVVPLARRLHRELEWIPLKAMRKDRCRRYKSASDMADDIQNYLNGNPLLAGPETAVYRVKKFVHKHAGSVVTVTLVAIAIVLGLIVSIVMFLKAEEARLKEANARTRSEQAEAAANEQRKIAEQQRSEAVEARNEAQMYSETVKTLMPFFQYDNMLVKYPWAGAGRAVPVECWLETASGSFESNFKGPPLLRAEVYSFFLYSLPATKGAPYGQKAIEIRRNELGEGDPLTLITMNNLGYLYTLHGQPDNAESVLAEAIRIGKRDLGDDHHVTHDSIECMAMLAKKLEVQGIDEYRRSNYDGAVAALTKSDRLRRSFLNRSSHAVEVGYLAMSLKELGRVEESQLAMRRLRRLCIDEEFICPKEQSCWWKAERLLIDESSTIRNAWGHIEAGRLDKVSELLDKLQTRPGTEVDQQYQSLANLKRALARAYYLHASRGYKRGRSIDEILADYHESVVLDPNLTFVSEEMACLQTSISIPVVSPMVAWWKFDKTDNRILTDSSGNGNNGTLSGDVVLCAGRIGSALSFDGEGDYVDCGDNPSFDITDKITIACWIRVSEFTSFCQATIVKGESSWRLQRFWTTPFMEFACTGIEVETNELGHVIGNTNMEDGQWHHVTGVYNGRTICLYIDGILDNFEFASGKISVNDQPVRIGSHSYSQDPGGMRYWNGDIDDVRIYSYDLCAEEIKNLYEGKDPSCEMWSE